MCHTTLSSAPILAEFTQNENVNLYFSSFPRESEQSCKKQMERVLNIWQERVVYEPDFIQQLKLTVDESSSPVSVGMFIIN